VKGIENLKSIIFISTIGIDTLGFGMESSILQGNRLRARIGLVGVILVAGCLGANAATYYVMVR
jgi:hypothetical protein